MASRQLVLFLFLVICINMLGFGWYYNQSMLVYISLLNVLLAFFLTLRDFFTQETGEAPASGLVSGGMLGYVLAFVSAGYLLDFSKILLAIVSLFGIFLLVSLCKKYFAGIIKALFVAIAGGLGYSIYTLWPNAPVSLPGVVVYTGEILDGSSGTLEQGSGIQADIYDDVLTGAVTSGTIVTGNAAEVIIPPVVPQPIKKPVAPLSGIKKITGNLFAVERSKKPVTFAMLMSLVTAKYKLSTVGTVAFKYVTPKNPLYPAYIAGYKRGMIGIATSPIVAVTCGQLMTSLGLAEAPALSKGSANIQNTYREYAIARGFTKNGCNQKGAIATLATMP